MEEDALYASSLASASTDAPDSGAIPVDDALDKLNDDAGSDTLETVNAQSNDARRNEVVELDARLSDDAGPDDDETANLTLLTHDFQRLDTSDVTEPPAKLDKQRRRRRRRADKPTVSSNTGSASSLTCDVCKQAFPSRTKLFAHLDATGHATRTTSKKKR